MVCSHWLKGKYPQIIKGQIRIPLVNIVYLRVPQIVLISMLFHSLMNVRTYKDLLTKLKTKKTFKELILTIDLRLCMTTKLLPYNN
jgi:hypothetical protein